MPALYNEIDAYAADWLVNLEQAGHIAAGRVDRRSVVDLRAEDFAEVTQAHFFAGLGGWSHALRLADWPDDAGVWTGSCPCQPFSGAGRKRGFADDRHLWPAWFRLIRECRPTAIFGEQVAGPDGLRWLDAVSADLEGLGYAVGAANLCAGGVGAPHIRQRLYFVAHARGERFDGLRLRLLGRRSREAGAEVAGGGEIDSVAYADELAGRQGRALGGGRGCGGDAESMARSGGGREPRTVGDAPVASGAIGELVDANDARPQRYGRSLGQHDEERRRDAKRHGATAGFWADAEWLPCLDGKLRPTKPGLHPLAHGVRNRVGRLRAGGNAIVPQVAATFIRAAVESIAEL